MKLSLFNEKLTLELSKPIADHEGNHRLRWTEYFSCRTYVAATTYKQGESEKAGQTIGANGLVFTVRYCSETARVDTTHFRVRFRGEPYNITSIDMLSYDRKYIKLTCERESEQPWRPRP